MLTGVNLLLRVVSTSFQVFLSGRIPEKQNPDRENGPDSFYLQRISPPGRERVNGL